MLFLDKYYALNEGTILRNDKKRVIIYEKYLTYSDKLKSKTGYNHHTLVPALATCFSLFDGTLRLSEILDFVKDYFKLSDDEMLIIEKDILKLNEFYSIFDTPKKRKMMEDISQILPNLNDNKEWDMKASYTYYPTTILFLPTMDCVVDCTYCYAQRNHKYLPLEYMKVEELLKEAIHEFQISEISLSGGDIFLYKHYEKLLQFLSINNYFPELATKKPLFDELYLLKDFGFTSFQYSLDTLNPVISKTMLNNLDSYDYVQNIEKSISLAEKLDIKVSFNIVITKNNMNDINNLLDILLKYSNVYRIALSPIGYSLYKRGNMKKLMLEEDDYDQILKVNKILFEEIETKIEHFKSLEKSSFWGQKPILETNKYWERALCSGGRYSFVVLPDGLVTICEELYWNKEFIIGDLKKQTLREISDSKERWNLLFPDQKKFPADSPCYYCESDNFNKCHAEKGRCLRDSLKYFRKEHYPDQRCPFFKDIAIENNLTLNPIWDFY